MNKMAPSEMIQILKQKGFNFFTGVPCSLFGNTFEILHQEKDIPYIPASREDEAVGIACGAFLGTRLPVVLMQNSGLGNCLNALTSLSIIYKIPTLLLMTWRGEGGKDAPEHIVMGEACKKILDDIGISHRNLSPETFEKDLDWILSHFERNRIPAALWVRKGVLC